MSVVIMGQVWELALPPSTKMVLLALANHAWDDGTHVYPGMKRLKALTQLSERTIQEHLSRLQAAGLIELVAYRDGGRGHATEWRIRARRGPADPLFAAEANPADAAPILAERAQMTALKGAPAAPQPVGTVVEGTSEQVPSRPRKPRPADPIWDALCQTIGHEPQTDDERGRFNRAVKQLRKIGADMADIRARGVEFRRRWPDCEFTPQGLTGNWTTLGTPRAGPVARTLTQFRTPKGET